MVGEYLPAIVHMTKLPQKDRTLYKCTLGPTALSVSGMKIKATLTKVITVNQSGTISTIV